MRVSLVHLDYGPAKSSLGRKILQIPWGLVFLLCVTAVVGFAMLYSAAHGSYEPWAGRQIARFAAGLLLMLTLAVIDIRWWLRSAYAIYFIALVLLGLVAVMGGTTGAVLLGGDEDHRVRSVSLGLAQAREHLVQGDRLAVKKKSSGVIDADGDRRRDGGRLTRSERLHLHGQQVSPDRQHHRVDEERQQQEDHVDQRHDLNAGLVLRSAEREHGGVRPQGIERSRV